MSFKRAAIKLPLWRSSEVNAFSGLFINLLVNVVTITILATAVVHLPTSTVTGTILPALGIELLIGNIFYFALAVRLARKEGRDDVTAMPYGPSVPHMFLVTLVIMLPIYLKTHDPIKAWEAGLAWAFIIGLIILLGAFIGPTVRRLTPRAALLGTLAGISLTFIAMRPASQMWEATWIALPVLMIIIAGFISGVRLPGNIPIGLAALLLGTAIGWIGGYMHTADVSAAAKDIAVGLPTLNIHRLGNGFSEISSLLATAIPLGVYNFTEAMSNVESASAAGDSYNLRSVLLADGTGAVVGAALGSPFPPAVYIGQPGWKEVGGRYSYSLATGVVVCVALLRRAVPAAGGGASGACDRAGSVVHRAGDRKPGFPRCAPRLLSRGRPRDGPQPRRLGRRLCRRCAQRRRDVGGAGRADEAWCIRRRLRRAARPRQRGGTRRDDPRGDRGVPNRPPVHEGGRVLRRWSRSFDRGAHPWRQGPCVHWLTRRPWLCAGRHYLRRDVFPPSPGARP